MNAVTYLRVSTEGQTVEPQRLELSHYAATRKWIITSEFADVISGTKVSREALDRLMAAVRRGEVQTVLVVKLDRLARSLQHFAGLIAEFKKHNVALVCPGQGIDTSTSNPAGRLQMNVLAAVAEFERDIIVERTKAGLAAARARGTKLGHASTRLPVNHPEIIRRWYVDTGGTSLRDLAMRLNGVALSTAFDLAKKFKPAA